MAVPLPTAMITGVGSSGGRCAAGNVRSRGENRRLAKWDLVVLRIEKTEIEYPQSDGQPMGETDLHRWWMIRITDWLRRDWRQQPG